MVYHRDRQRSDAGSVEGVDGEDTIMRLCWDGEMGCEHCWGYVQCIYITQVLYLIIAPNTQVHPRLLQTLQVQVQVQ